MEFPRHAQVPQGGSHDLNFGESYTRKKDSRAIQESLRKYVIPAEQVLLPDESAVTGLIVECCREAAQVVIL